MYFICLFISRPTIKKIYIYLIFSFVDKGGGNKPLFPVGSYNFLHLSKYILLRVVFVIKLSKFYIPKN